MLDKRAMIEGRYNQLKRELKQKSLSASTYLEALAGEIDPILGKEIEVIDFEKVEGLVSNLKKLQQDILECKEKMDEIDGTYNIE